MVLKVTIWLYELFGVKKWTFNWLYLFVGLICKSDLVNCLDILKICLFRFP